MRVDRKYALLLVIGFGVSVGWYFWGFSRTPQGQPPLTSLTPSNLDQFKRQFNDVADRGIRRLVLGEKPARHQKKSCDDSKLSHNSFTRNSCALRARRLQTSDDRCVLKHVRTRTLTTSNAELEKGRTYEELER